ncbi:hypothetical protein DPMN_030238 [Dreissena polymorpha]|uniref:Uncharacterized protein n=1 Tax=Dreissena polymorpha TaxID=45954 RepID=A0A9D4LYN8_DREPO|nr:hypothetical protein DPMN_030238 [Dreissena polymorpha]
MVKKICLELRVLLSNVPQMIRTQKSTWVACCLRSTGTRRRVRSSPRLSRYLGSSLTWPTTSPCVTT